MAHRFVQAVAAVAAWRRAAARRSRRSRRETRLRLRRRARPARGRSSQPASNGVTPGRLAVGAEGDLLDPRLRRLQPRLAMALQPVAFLVELDRLVERRLAALEQCGRSPRAARARPRSSARSAVRARPWPRNDPRRAVKSSVAALERVADARDDLVGAASSPASAAASAASASRACCSRSARSSSISASRSLSKRRVGRSRAARPPSAPWRSPHRARAGVVRPSVTGSFGVMFAMFQWRALADRGDGRAGRADQLADLAVADLGMVADDPGDSVRLVLALADTGV